MDEGTPSRRCHRHAHIARRSYAPSTAGPAAPPSGRLPSALHRGYAPHVGAPIGWRCTSSRTIATSGPSEHGDWTIKVDGIGVNAEVHAYVARSDPNMGVRTGARRSYFVDPSGGKPGRPRPVASTSMASSTRPGRWSIAMAPSTGSPPTKDASVHVAGGYILANGRKSPYSSAGPAAAAATPRSRLRAALRRVLRARRHTCRRQQERRRVSPEGHQRRGTATGSACRQSPATVTEQGTDPNQRNSEARWWQS